MPSTSSSWDWDELLKITLAVFFLIVIGVGSAFGAGYLAIRMIFETFLGGLQ